MGDAPVDLFAGGKDGVPLKFSVNEGEVEAVGLQQKRLVNAAATDNHHLIGSARCCQRRFWRIDAEAARCFIVGLAGDEAAAPSPQRSDFGGDGPVRLSPHDTGIP